MSISGRTFILTGVLALCLQPEVVFAKQMTRNVTVRVDKPTIVWRHFILNARTDAEAKKCQGFRPPTIIVRRKPKLGKVKIRRGVRFASDKRSPCKGKEVTGTTVEYTGTKRGKDSFKVEIVFRYGSYSPGYDHKFDDVTFNISVR